MSWFSNLSIRKKLAIGFGGLLVLTLALSISSLLGISKVNDSTTDLATNWLPSVKYIASIRSNADRIRRAELGWLLVNSKDAEAKYETKIEAAKQHLKKDIGKYEPLISSDEERRLYNEFQAKLQDYFATRERVIALKQSGQVEEARTLGLGHESEAINAAYDAIERNVELNAKGGDVAAQHAAASYASTRLYLIVLSAAGIGVGILLTFLVSAAIAGPLGTLVSCFRRGAEGDLTTHIDQVARDEVGQVSGMFNTFMQGLQDTMRQVASSSQQVATASEEISSAATQSAQGSAAQSDQVTQVATAMQEMSSTVVEVSNNSGKAAEEARNAAAAAKQGGQIVSEALETMRSIATSVGATAKKIDALGKNSDQIGKIIAVIDDIADQTNLLALNAAIEAARAGEQGRGFAVVADEVRKLAERTTKATKEIAQMIETVQTETKTAVANMEAGTKQVEAGVTTTAKAGTSLEEIITVAQHVGDMITQIATAAAEQTSTAEQINSNVDQIAKISHESAAGAQQSAKACEELSNLALDLQALVSRFKVGDDSGQGNLATATRSYGQDSRPRRKPAAAKTNGHSLINDYDSQEPVTLQ